MSQDVNERLFEIATYLVTSAPTVYDETPALAAFRLVDGANRLLDLMAETGAVDDEFVRGAREEFAKHLNEVMTDQEAFRAWLSDYVRTFTQEALRRIPAGGR